jgi:hypothetical protein
MSEIASPADPPAGKLSKIRSRISQVGWRRSILFLGPLWPIIKPWLAAAWEWIERAETASFVYEMVPIVKTIIFTFVVWWVSHAQSWSSWAVPLITGGLLIYLIVEPERESAQGQRFSIRTHWLWIFLAVIIVFVVPSFITVPSKRVTTPAKAIEESKWSSAADAIDAFAPAAIRTDYLPQASNALRQQLQSGQLVARAYSKEQGKYVDIATEDWQFLNLVIRENSAGGNCGSRLCMEAGSASAGLHYLGVEVRRGMPATTTITPPTDEHPLAISAPRNTVSASWTLIKPGHFPPGDFRNVPIATFVTEGASDRLIGTNGPFKALRFMKPTEKTVHAEDLPATINYQAGYLVVKRFTDKGFTVDENGARGVEIEAEVYH